MIDGHPKHVVFNHQRFYNSESEPWKQCLTPYADIGGNTIGSRVDSNYVKLAYYVLFEIISEPLP